MSATEGTVGEILARAFGRQLAGRAFEPAANRTNKGGIANRSYLGCVDAEG